MGNRGQFLEIKDFQNFLKTPFEGSQIENSFYEDFRNFERKASLTSLLEVN